MKYGISCGAPADVRDEANADGSPCESENTMTVKNAAMLTTIPVFCKVVLIQEADPLFSGGTEFIIEAMFGAANIPIPKPCTYISTANSR